MMLMLVCVVQKRFLPWVKSLAVSFGMSEQTGLEWWSLRFVSLI
jgi:hypothetical protein